MKVILAHPLDLPSFDLGKVMGEPGWSFDGKGKQALAFQEVDISGIRAVSMLREGESWISGHETIRRLRTEGKIRLDPRFAQLFWDHRQLFPKEWETHREYQTDPTTRIFFHGQTFWKRPCLFRYAFYISYRPASEYPWDRGEYHLDLPMYPTDLTAVLVTR